MVVSCVADAVASAWSLVAKASRVCMRLKSWWSEDCTHAKCIALKVNTKNNWIALNKATKCAKRKFFNNRIAEISEKTRRPWDLMDWVGPRKIPPMKAITFKGRPCLSLDAVWSALHSTFNSAADWDTDVIWVFPGLPVRDECPWLDFSLAEMMEALAWCSGRSAPGPDHLTWTHLKCLVAQEEVAALFLWIANACLRVGVWLKELKESKTVVIPKLGKPSYDVPKAVRPIVLLNTMGKLFEKMIANCLQFEAAKEGILHPCQFGGVCQNSTEDAGIYLTHLVR